MTDETRVNVARCTEYLNRFNALNSIDSWVSEVEKTFFELLPYDYTGLYIYDHLAGKLELKAAYGFSEEEKQEANRTCMVRHPGLVFESGQGFYVPDVQNDPLQITSDSKRSFLVKTRLYEPVKVDGVVVGVFGIVSERVNAFSQDDRLLFEFVIQLAATTFNRITTAQENHRLGLMQERLSFIATHTNNMVIIADTEGKIEWANKAFEDVTGYALNEIIGKRPGTLLQGKASDSESISQMRVALRERKTCDVKLTNYRKNGERYDAHVQIFPVCNKDGELVCFVSLQRDITQEVAYTREIETHRSRLKAMLSALPDQLLIAKSSGELFKMTEDLFDYMAPSEHLRLHDMEKMADRERFLCLVQQSISTRQTQHHEMTCPTMGAECAYEFRIVGLDDSTALVLQRDVSEKRKLERERTEYTAQIEQTLQRLEVQNSRLMNFANILSHNIRSNTSNIKSLVKLLEMKVDSDELRPFMLALGKSSDNLDGTIRSLYTSITAFLDHAPEKEELLLIEVIDKVLESLIIDIQNASAGIDIRFLSDFTVYANPVYLESIVQNLVSNALKYRKEDEGLLLAFEARNIGEECELIVSDNGIGIDLEKHRDQIFGPFETFSNRKGGHGIGLFIVRNQIEAMDGTISVKSALDQGTSFTIKLPTK